MLLYIIRRLGYLVITIFFVSLLTYALLFMGGDPAVFLTPVRPGLTPTDEMIEMTRRRYNLDEPIIVQYATYMSNLLKGDMGDSFFFHRPVADLIFERLPKTMLLAVMIMVVSLLIGLPLGVFASLHKNSWFDRAVLVSATFLVSVPEFLIAFFLLFIFASELGWFPLRGTDSWAGWVLPVLSVAISRSVSYAIFLRTNMLNALGENYARVARAKGLQYTKVALKHILPNALIPVVALAGLNFAGLMTGVIIIETVFGIAGIGLTVARATSQRDIPVILASVFFTSIAFSLFNLLADVVVARLDPRIRLEK